MDLALGQAFSGRLVLAFTFRRMRAGRGIDSLLQAAARERQAEFVQAARQGYIVAAAHISFPGLGYVNREGRSYAWQPVPYALDRTVPTRRSTKVK